MQTATDPISDAAAAALTLETTLLSVTPAHLAKLEQDRPKVGGRLRALKGHVDRPLAAILTLNTTANTVGAAGVGAEAQRLWGSEVLAITSAALTLLILFLAEIIPSARLALGETDRLSQATASLR